MALPERALLEKTPTEGGRRGEVEERGGEGIIQS